LQDFSTKPNSIVYRNLKNVDFEKFCTELKEAFHVLDPILSPNLLFISQNVNQHFDNFLKVFTRL